MGSEPAPAGDETAVVRCRGVTHEFDGRGDGAGWLDRWRSSNAAPTVTALRAVDLAVGAGEMVGIEGPSGSGKSTLLHAMAGLLAPTGGAVELVGTDLASVGARERARLRRRHVGIVFQRFHLLGTLSARANVALPLVQLGVPRSKRRERAEALLEDVGLGDRHTHQPGPLSGGERQRVAIARALVTDPALVLADEPTGELDRATSETVLDLLASVGRERAVVVASHDETALARCDRVLTLTDGRVTGTYVPDGTVERGRPTGMRFGAEPRDPADAAGGRDGDAGPGRDGEPSPLEDDSGDR